MNFDNPYENNLISWFTDTPSGCHQWIQRNFKHLRMIADEVNQRW